MKVFITTFLLSLNTAFCEVLTLDALLASTKEKFPVIIAALQEIPAAKGELLSAEGSFDPSLSFDANGNAAGYYDGKRFVTTYNQPLRDLYGSRLFSSYSISRGDYPIYDGKFVTNDGGEIRAGIEVPFLRDSSTDRRRAQIDRSKVGIDLAKANVRQREIEVTRSAVFTYYDWAAAGARKKIYENLLSTAVKRTSQIRQRVKSGDLPEFDLTDNVRAELQRKTQFLSAERAFRQSSFDVSLFWRDEEDRPVIPEERHLPKTFPKPDIKDYVHAPTIDLALEARPELKRLDAQKKQNQIELDLQKNQLQPRLDVLAGAANDMGDGPRSIGEAEAFFGVRVEIPLMVRTARGRIEQAEAKRRELDALESLQRDRVRNEVQDALIGLDLARKRTAIAEQERKAADDLAQGEATRLDLGDSNLIFVNLREQTAAEAAVREIDALLDYQKALAAYRAASGVAFFEE